VHLRVADRHRGRSEGVPSLGKGVCCAVQRHVRPGYLGSANPTPFPGARRYGIKPLYYWWAGGRWYLPRRSRQCSDFPASRWRCGPRPARVFHFPECPLGPHVVRGVRLLPAGHTLCMGTQTGGQPSFERYWDFVFAETRIDPAEAEDELFRLLEQAVHRQLVSDVPLGSYLSGGIDSGSIAGLASATGRA